MTKAVHNYFYMYMWQFFPAWRLKWNVCLAAKDWQKIHVLMTAIFNRLPADEQRIIEPSINSWQPWWPVQRTYTAKCDLVGKDGRISCRWLSVDIVADSRAAAEAELLKQGYIVKLWM